ncbi:hypothetical protein A2685_01255 [Candidatus Woesebacteria bacterium RIFCSPHIGHO2_01_FULL_37_10]|uniref:Metallopeptidase family protein n=1 Tax=Candidatus Woesebacteria bacterium RIFCSPHIGHO2_01_FULL_37_10 TaxID=1802489 RepID=A0A1F7XY01_9BACT|nr:MAG: hypothetical protein A2685_01255 [Candidatus Woesebacteria bacterium RIFCSPHIGHO2_01_FULL_37_10]
MHDEEFEKYIKEVIESLPKEFAGLMENVVIFVEELPTQGQINILRKRGEGGILLGLYEGIPRTRRGRYGIGETLPDRISIFKNAILMISNSPDEIKENIRNTVIHEIAHHFGLSDEDIKKARSGV